MYNQYYALPLCEVHGILQYGTVWLNQQSLPNEKMNLSPTSNKQDELLVLYDEIHRVLAIQWLDQKVVCCISTLDETGLIPAEQKKGNDLLQLSVEISLNHYQDGMGGVNHGDQYHETVAGFASKSHYKKWYKQPFLVFKIFILNSFSASNIFTSDIP